LLLGLGGEGRFDFVDLLHEGSGELFGVR
jgi:hypothetical protein